VRIGRDLGITVNGVGSVNKQILQKLGATCSANAVFLACQAGVLDGRPQKQEPAVILPAPWVEVLELVATGHTNEEIAEALGRSKNTVIDQVAAVRKRLGARDRAHAAALAVALQLVRVDVTSEVRAEAYAA
jgi:DNA-binding NarL/FixJ family response regulator